MKVLLLFIILITSSGCATVNLFEHDSYKMTKAGDRIMRGTNVLMETTFDGIWYSKEAIEKLQRAKVIW